MCTSTMVLWVLLDSQEETRGSIVGFCGSTYVTLNCGNIKSYFFPELIGAHGFLINLYKFLCKTSTKVPIHPR